MKKEKTSELGKAWLKREMKPYRASIVFLTVLTVFSTLFSLAFAYVIRYLINSATAQNEKALLLFAIVTVSLLLLKIFFQTLQSFLSERLRARMTQKQRVSTFSKILRSNYAKISEYHSGDLLTRLTSDIAEVVTDTVGLLPALVGLGVQCVGAVVALATLDPLFTVLYVVCGLLGGGIAALFRKRIKTYQKDFLSADGKVRSFMQESMGSMLTIKAYSATGVATEKAEDFSQEYYQTRMRRNVLRTIMSAVFSLLSNLGLIFAIVWCSVGLLTGAIQPDDFGVVLSIVLLLQQLQHPFSAISAIIPVFSSRMASAERLQEIEAFAEEEGAVSQETAIDYAQLDTIVLDGVSFDYGRANVLHDASMCVKKGEIVCVTGASGSGKSTLFKLLLGVYTPQKGEITMRMGEQSVPLNEGGVGAFAYVPQGNFLFSGTIEENLTFFCGEAMGDCSVEMKNALATACAEFVYELPDGVKTMLSERGAGLSEGQLQRLAIARALLSGRGVLLLDEATSALDAETEARLLKNIKALQDKTCILVTHREAALSIADAVYDVKDGTIEKVIAK